MRRLSIAAVMAVPLIFLVTAGKTQANPPAANGFGCGDFCLGLFKNIHQHGPLFNYGPYYGYYPFAPYGPWDAYLRYDPFFYGDPYANWRGHQGGLSNDSGNMYGRNQNLQNFPRIGVPHIGLPHWDLFHKHGCTSCGFWHASWLHGGWYRGHTWLQGGTFGLFHKPSCSSCGGVSRVAKPELPTGDVFGRYSGIGAAEQSAVFYPATPTLNPVLGVVSVK